MRVGSLSEPREIVDVTPNLVSRALQLFLRGLLIVIGVVVVAAAWGRWDRIGHLDDARWRLLLTMVGLAMGAWLGMIQARGAERFPRTATISLVGILFSQVCYLILV